MATSTLQEVTPIAPGGPALRSHIAIVEPGTTDRVIEVLARAHQQPLGVGPAPSGNGTPVLRRKLVGLIVEQVF